MIFENAPPFAVGHFDSIKPCLFNHFIRTDMLISIYIMAWKYHFNLAVYVWSDHGDLNFYETSHDMKTILKVIPYGAKGTMDS